MVSGDVIKRVVFVAFPVCAKLSFQDIFDRIKITSLKSYEEEIDGFAHSTVATRFLVEQPSF